MHVPSIIQTQDIQTWVTVPSTREPGYSICIQYKYIVLPYTYYISQYILGGFIGFLVREIQWDYSERDETIISYPYIPLLCVPSGEEFGDEGQRRLFDEMLKENIH